MYTDIFAAGVSILRTEIEIRDKISLQTALHSNTIIVEGLDYQSYVNKRIKEVREKIIPIRTVEYHPDIKKFTFLKIKDFTPQPEKPARAIWEGNIMDKIANNLSYYDEDLFLVTTEGAFVIGCDGYINEVRELLELSISLFLLFQIYDREIDLEISNDSK